MCKFEDLLVATDLKPAQELFSTWAGQKMCVHSD